MNGPARAPGSPGKVCLVTGASSGIGAAIARGFGQAGYRVFMAGRDADRTAAVARETGCEHTWIGDLTEPGAAAALVAACLERLGRLDVLVNNAGIYLPGNAEGCDDEAWGRTLAVNLDAAFFLSRESLPHLRRTRGCIINIASDWGLNGGRDAVAYCASKGGMVLMSRAMALDHAAEGIRVNAICPGDVETPMLYAEGALRGLDRPAAVAEAGAAIPTGRVTAPDEVAALALFLASDGAAQITGTAIPIDGGQTAG